MLPASNLATGVEVRATAAGTIVIEKYGAMSEYKKRLYEVAERRTIRGITGDELMKMTRGYSEGYPQKKTTSGT